MRHPPAHVIRPRPLVALLPMLAIVAASCSKPEAQAARPAPTTTVAPTTTSAPAPPPPFPLTGLPATDLALLDRPALVVKIENNPAARPQSGLELADIVYEEVVEGGITRFLAVFHSRDAGLAGPIRSVRPSDPDIVWPLKPLFSYAGGVKKFVGMLRQAPVVDVGVDAKPDAYNRRPGRQAPHNLYSSTDRLYGPRHSGSPPPSVIPFLAPGQPFEALGATPAQRLEVLVGSTAVAYDWDAQLGGWRRFTDGTPHVVDSGAQLAPTNVIVQFVDYQVSPGDVDVAGSPVSVIHVVGEGEAWMFANGQFVKGRWSKPAPEAVTSFTDVNGLPILFPPGSTWVELAPAGTSAGVG